MNAAVVVVVVTDLHLGIDRAVSLNWKSMHDRPPDTADSILCIYA